ncbi:Rho termination factor N-terminal domain-containing protein [candidate division KSB1 bacterium]
MTESYEELQKMTVKALREFAQENTGIVGVTGLKKDQLIDAICEDLEIEKTPDTARKDEKKPVSQKAKKSKVDLSNKQSAKQEILRLKEKKTALMQDKTKNYRQLKNIRRRIRRIKMEIRKVS